jgi:pyruvate formate lyase activating enzyme
MENLYEGIQDRSLFFRERAMNGAKGTIFNIQRYSIHDGPGIRTTVFMKGCPLRCLWCQNPESQTFHPELFYHSESCKGCGKCMLACVGKAIEIHEGRSKTNRKLCKGCGTCADVCPQGARALVGRMVSAEEVFQEVSKDAIFYQRSGGGVTLSGGEPLAQPEFAIDLLKLSKEAGIHTALDTCGQAPWQTIERMLKYVDLVLYDLKHMDPVEHERATGASNHSVLENARRMCHDARVSLMIRIPLIPGFNDGLENMRAMAAFIVKELDASMPVHLLPYHKFGESKRAQLERNHPSLGIEPPSDEYLDKLKELLETLSLKVVIGG